MIDKYIYKYYLLVINMVKKGLVILLVFLLFANLVITSFVMAENENGYKYNPNDNWLTNSFSFVKENTRVVWQPVKDQVGGEIKTLLGVRNFGELIGSFFYFLLQGVIAGLILYGFIFLFSSLVSSFNIFETLSIWILSNPLKSSLGIGGLYAITMSIPVINRIIEVVTLQIFTFPLDSLSQFVLRTLLLAVFLILVIFAPAIALALKEAREKAKTIKATNEIVRAIEVQKATGKALGRK